MGALKYGGPLMSIFVRIANLMILSFFWLVCSLPVVTVLPASAALYHTTVKVVRESGSGVVRDFFKSFVGALRKGVLLSLLTAAAGGLLAYALFLVWQAKDRSLWGAGYFVLGVFFSVILASAVIHMVPALARFEGGVDMYVRMGLYFAGRSPLRTFSRILLLALTVFLADFYPLALLILPGVYMDLVAPGLEKQLEAFIKENGLDDAPDQAESGSETQEVQPSMPSIELDRLLSAEEEDKDE